MTGAVRRGRVDSFDDAAGLGVIKAEDGAVFPFHCTQIADGTRAIDPGTPVEFVVFPGHMGRWEAGAVSPLDARGS